MTRGAQRDAKPDGTGDSRARSMATQTLFTTFTCNQGCGFCTFRRPEDPLGHLSGTSLAKQIREATTRGASELVFSGGEPLLSPDLTLAVTEARAAGFERVVVETNGMLLAYQDRARALADAGGVVVRVAVNAANDELSDALSRRPGGFALTKRGVANAIAAGLEVELSIAITRRNLQAVLAIPDWVRATYPAIRRLRISVVHEAPDPSWIPTYPEAAGATVALADEAARQGLNATFAPGRGIPLCFFPERRRHAGLFEYGGPRTSSGELRIEECGTCAARHRCRGVASSYLAVHGTSGAEAVPEKEERFVLGLGRDRRAAVEKELLNEALFRNVDGRPGRERIVRVNFHCNQSCEFCFVDRTLPAVSHDRIEQEIRAAAEDGVDLLSLSGGEPTLHPALVHYVDMATSLGLQVQIQTNAILCAREGYAEKLAGAGLERAFVSLHAADPSLSDELTDAPGTFERTLAGVDALIDAGVSVTLNCVVTARSHQTLSSYAAFVAARFGRTVSVCLSLVHASTDLVPNTVALVPRHSEVRTHLRAAIATFEEAGIDWYGFDGQCGVPLCLLDDAWYDPMKLPRLPEPNPPRGFMKPARCRTCALDDRCVGIRKNYVALYGSGELSPLCPNVA